MSDVTKKAILRAILDGVLTELYPKTNADQVILSDGSTLSEKLSEYITALNGKATSSDITNAIAALDVSDTAQSGKYVSAVSEVDGKITVTRADLPTADVYSITKDTASSDYAAVYHLTKGGTNTGVDINIPKDMVVSSGEVVTNPSGQAAGTYLKLTLANATNDEIFINVGSLIEYVTSGSASGDMVVVSVDSNHKVTASITDGTITLAKLAAGIQTEINKAHSHSNKALLDSYTQTEANLADAVAKKHSHTNQTVLDDITSDKVTAWDAKSRVIVAATQPADLAAGDLFIQLTE